MDWETAQIFPDYRPAVNVIGRGGNAFPREVAEAGLAKTMDRLAVLNDHLADHAERYPRVELANIDRADLDLVLLPDEPYVFTADDGPEAFTRVPTRLVSGRLLTWYGPSLLEAAALRGRLDVQP